MLALRLILALATVSAFFLGTDVEACSCLASGPPCEAYWNTPVVFTGLVIDFPAMERFSKQGSQQIFHSRRVQLTVERAFKGVSTGPVEVLTGSGGGDCGYPFRIGERYLVYAHPDSRTGQIVTGICTRTQPLSRADADLAFLASLAQPQSSGRIFGQVSRHVFDMKEGRDGERAAIAGVAVTAAGPTRSFRAVTDNGGTYVFLGLPPGAYLVTADLHPGLTLEDEPRRAQLFAGGCARVDFFARPDGEISGKVYRPDGNPAPKLRLELVPEDLADSGPIGKTLSAYSDEGGFYVFRTVPPGQYIVGIHISQPPSADFNGAPYPRTFFPGVLNLRDAVPIKLAEGEKRLNQDLRIPVQLQERVIQGVVEWPDGTPAIGASVRMEDVEYPFRQVTYASAVDAQGRFTLSGFGGYAYVIFAWIASDAGGPSRQMHAEPVEIAPDAQAFVRLVIASPGGNCPHYKRKKIKQ